MSTSSRSWRVLFAILCFWLFPLGAFAAAVDTDGDGLLDVWEERLFRTRTDSADTDGDGFADGVEVRSGFDPLQARPGARLVEQDGDADGLVDALEIAFGSDPLDGDTDRDGYQDGTEVKNAYDPIRGEAKSLEKLIRVDLSEQKLYQELNGVVIAAHPVSSGKARTPTPVGTFKIMTKSPRAWSGSAKLWMPYWMGFKGWTYGIHELPEWPGGKKEGKDHLGTPVSHGCVRIGEGVSKLLYDWTPIGTTVVIQR